MLHRIMNLSLLVLLLCFGLAACQENSENSDNSGSSTGSTDSAGSQDKEHRAQFKEFLQTIPLQSELVVGAKMTDAQKEQVGPYAEHYAIIERFFQTIHDAEQSQKQIEPGILGNHAKMLEQEGKEALEISLNSSKNLVAAIDNALQAAETEKKALKQPGDIKELFDTTYEKEVVRFGNAKKDLYLKSQAFFEELKNLVSFLEERKDFFEIKDRTLMLKKYDATVAEEMQKMQQKMQVLVEDLQKADYALREMLFTGHKQEEGSTPAAD